MHHRGVAEVEQVVGDEPIAGVHHDPVPLAHHPAAVRIEQTEVRYQSRIGRPLAHPDPKHRVLLVDRIAADLHVAWNAPIAMRVADALSATIELQAMIRATDMVAVHDPALGQWTEPVRTDIGDGGSAPVGLAKQHDRLVQERARHEFARCQVLCPQRRVPSVAKEFHAG